MLHKTILFWVTVLVCAVNQCLAQNSFEQHKARYSALQPYVPSAILADRSPHQILANDSVRASSFFPGAGRKSTAYHFKQLYNWAYQAHFAPVNWPEPQQLPQIIDSSRLGFLNANASWPQIAQIQSRADVVMGSLLLEYNEVASDAFQNNYIFYEQQTDKFKLRLEPYQHTDTVWLSGTPGIGNFQVQTFTFNPNPSQTLANWKLNRQLFVLAPLNNIVIVGPGQPIRFVFDDLLNKSNISGATLEVDFDDNLGFRTIQVGSIISTLSNRSGEVILKYRMKAANGTVVGDLVNYSSITIIRSKRESELIYFSANPSSCNFSLNAGVGEAQLNFALSAHSNGKLKRPFILVEGFETTIFDKQNAELDLKTNGGFGALNWYTINSSDLNRIGYNQLSSLPELIDSLLMAGFDVGFVDFRTNRAIIEKNGNALISLLQQVGNTLAQNGSSEGIQLMGASMGGLIARNALSRMEAVDCCHEVNVYYSFSSPHLGANIPIGLQHFVYDLGTKFNILGANVDHQLTYTQVLNSPAARQMLIVHRESSAYSEHLNFIQQQNQLGLPTNVRRIALTDASLSGHLQRMNNDDESSPFIQELQTLFDFKLAVWAPMDFPIPDDFSGRRYSLMEAKGRVMPHSPNVQSQDWVYYSGRSSDENFANISQQYLRLFRGYGFLALNVLFHEAAKLAFPTFVIPISISEGIVAQSITGYHKNQLNLAINQHAQDNFLQRSYKLVPRASEGYDNAPGDYRSLLGTLEAGELHLFTEILPHHAFVHVSSSINESLSSRTVYLSNSTNTPFSGHFEKYNGVKYMNKPEYKNEVHVSLIGDRRDWIKSAILSYSMDELMISNAKNLSYKLSNDILSISGYEVFSKIKRIKINQYGTLKFNQQLLTYNQIGSSFLPVPNVNLNYSTSNQNCSESVIENYGSIELGEPLGSNYTNSADLSFLKNSRLILRDQSVMRINQNSKLLIDSGATLEVFGNAVILIEETGVLEVKGKILLNGTANLNIQGSGKVVLNPTLAFNENPRSFISTSGGRIIIQGNGPFNNRLTVLRSVFFPESLDLRMSQLGIRMAPNVRLDIPGYLKISNVRLQKLGVDFHSGIVLHGQRKVDITNLSVSGATKGITAFLVHLQNGLILNNVSFDNNEIGLESHGKSVRLNNVSFTNNGSGWVGYDIEGMNEIRSSIFSENQIGLNVMGQGDADLLVNQTTITNNQIGIQSFGQLYVRLNCNDISSNTIGVYAGNYQLLLGGGARNRFNYNQLAIKLEEVDNLYLADGENDFSGSEMYIAGDFSGIALNYLLYNSITQAYGIDILNNRMPVINGDTKILLRDWDLNPVFGQNFTPMPSGIQSCEPTQQSSYADYVLSNFVSQILVNTGTGNQSLNSAILEARAQISDNDTVNTGNHLIALNKFESIFNTWRQNNGTPDFSGNNSVLYDVALNLMLRAHNNAYRFGELNLNRANPMGVINSYTSNVVDEIDTRISELLNSNLAVENERIWSLQLLKAQVLRTSEHYLEAKQELENIQMVALGDWKATSDYWYCVCEAEEQLILGMLNPADFETSRLQCATLVPGLKTEIPKTGDKLTEMRPVNSYTVFPNPTTNKLYIKSEILVGNAQVSILSANGNEVAKFLWSDRGDLFQQELTGLSPGIYVVRVIDNCGVHHFSLVVN